MYRPPGELIQVMGDGPEKETSPEGHAVRELISRLNRCIRSFHLYPAGSPVFGQGVDLLYRSFQKFLGDMGELELSVGQSEIFYGQEPVYREADRSSSLAFKLFRNGIRRIAFAEGLEREELFEFVAVLAKDIDPEDLEDDLVTLLWEKSFSHITYQYVEEPFDQQGVEAFLSRPLGAGEGAGQEPSPDPTLMAALPSLLLEQGADGEVAKLASQQAASRDVFSRMLDILLEIFPHFYDQENFTHMVVKIRQLLAWFISQGEFHQAIEAISLVRGLVAREGTPAHSQVLEEELSKLHHAELFSRIGLYLEDDSPLFTEGAQLMQLLGPGVIPGLCDLLPALRTGAKLSQLLADISGDDIEPFLTRLTRPNWLAVKWMAAILGLKGHPGALEGLSGLLSHPESRVRREGVKALASFPAASVAKFLSRALDDSDYQVRTLALSAAEELNCTSLAGALEEMITRKDFPDRLPVEMRRVFAALGRLGGEAALPFLAKMVQTRTWLKREKWDEMRACAVAGLEAIASPEAIRFLEKEGASRCLPLREACLAALGRLAASRKGKGDGD